ncbi:hypothetical protein BJ165DRAFT_1572097 [Panaeolus papilionaceus]|nr:hypothetical protein BJ165DRAFT_1572097 [Panaeolus papilionaceus]
MWGVVSIRKAILRFPSVTGWTDRNLVLILKATLDSAIGSLEHPRELLELPHDDNRVARLLWKPLIPPEGPDTIAIVHRGGGGVVGSHILFTRQFYAIENPAYRELTVIHQFAHLYLGSCDYFFREDPDNVCEESEGLVWEKSSAVTAINSSLDYRTRSRLEAIIFRDQYKRYVGPITLRKSCHTAKKSI